MKKNKIEFFFQYFMFSSRFMLFPTLKKKVVYKKNSGGGGGCWIFFRKTILSHFTFYVIFNIPKKYWNPPRPSRSVYWLNGIYIHDIFCVYIDCSVIVTIYIGIWSDLSILEQILSNLNRRERLDITRTTIQVCLLLS